MIRKLLIFLILAIATTGAFAAVYSVGEVPNVNVENRSRFVSDPDSILRPSTIAAIDRALGTLRRDLTVEMAVVVVGDIPDNTDIETYATELYEAWGLGKTDKDNGALMVVAVDSHRAVIRTGYGLEGVLPDILAGRILRNDMFPAFRRGDIDSGVRAGVDRIVTIISDPEAADEVRSSLPDSYVSSDSTDPFDMYVRCAMILAVGMLVVFLVALLRLRGKDDHDKYVSLAGWRPAYLALTFLGLFMPLIASLPLLLVLWHWRNRQRKCPNCGAGMTKLDEETDNTYLTQAQDMEERLGTVDYDVWLCPHCHETDIEPYIQNNPQYIECDRCHALTAGRTGTRIIKAPTIGAPGKGATEYRCHNCGNTMSRTYVIPMLEVPPHLRRRGGLGRGFGGFSGGGGFGGGFGGGHTGGGGASGRW